jgi:hypothetical protein
MWQIDLHDGRLDAPWQIDLFCDHANWTHTWLINDQPEAPCSDGAP